MRYPDLHALIENSSSSRSFFLSLPTADQLKLHEWNEFIHDAHKLHMLADALKKR